MSAAELTDDQKRGLYRDGFVVLKGAVPIEKTRAARRLINMNAQNGLRERYHEIGENPVITDLINTTDFGEIVRNTIGPFDPPTRGFAPTLYPREPSDQIGIYGVPDNEVPNHVFYPHVDGLWAGPIPASANEVDDWNSPRTEHFGNGDASTIGGNRTPLFQDPDCKLSVGSFTAFAGVALNDQPEFGYGNFAVLKGAHHEVEKFFQWQRDQGDIIGPEGPGWPRLTRVGNDGVSLTFLPEMVMEKYRTTSEFTPDGKQWPEPTPLILEEGDAMIAVHCIPHCGTRNDIGYDPRMNVYFRIRRDRNDGVTVVGDSDHPDRHWDGRFREYAEGHDPWAVSIDALCDIWSQWDGMQDIVAEERANS